VLASLVLVCLALSAGSSHEPGGWGVVLLAGFSLLWFLVNGSVEGVVLVPCDGAGGLAVFRRPAWGRAQKAVG